ncbi:hypothetical protein RHSIM_Rhsim06G0176000 [Rhododendron simsii]|uniref:DUF4408 domain-containing protein n=1 Tax=Rhododendron simsii TaxID=118357 RepID=A0A834LM05_RHOSS|nr:hypothetical protein RHSIM_Rhsim06G0176000 [Rhododendron simsii]
MDQLTQFQLPKKPIQILLSLFAFSFLFSLSPFFPLFTNCIATLSSKILGYTTDRNYVFLFCNGILAFLIKKYFSADHSDRDLVAKIFDYQISGPEVAEKRELVGEEAVEFKEDKAKENDLVLSTSQDESTSEETEDQEEFIFSEEEEEEEEEGMGLMSAEEVDELNKKFEEFIRKVREGIKIEAQNRLIMSY